MSITPEELRNRTFQKLRLAKPGEAPSAEDADVIDKAYVVLFAEFEQLGIAGWIFDDIDDRYIDRLRSALAARVADDFQIPDARSQLLKTEGAIAENQIRSLNASFGPQPYKYTYF